MKRRGQDELTRRRRLNDGKCPTHGVHLQVDEVHEQGNMTLVCPRRDCSFGKFVLKGSKVWRAVHGVQ